jgi:protein-disulfide isomerase
MKRQQKNKIKKQLNKEIKILLLSLFALALIGGAFYLWSNNRSSDTHPPLSTILTREFNYKKGPETAKVKMVEFYDPECEACAAFFPYVKEIMSRYEKDVQLTVRFALYHNNSVLAAKATEAAGLQGKFWEFQELLFLNQPEWSHKTEPASQYFVKYAQDLNLDTKRFSSDMHDMKRMETINMDLEDGKNLGVNGTPTIFINGKKLLELNPRALQEAIEKELKE